MAEVSVLPIDLTTAGMVHLENMLIAAIEDGRDLGSRVPHMRVIGRSLGHQAQVLEDAIRELREDSAGLSPKTLADLKSFEAFVRNLRRVNSLTEALPNEENSN